MHSTYLRHWPLFQRFRVLIAVGLSALLVLACSRESLPLASGETLSLSQLQDKTLLVNVWAEWCAPCREEIPELNAMMEASDLIVVGIDFDRHPADKLPSVLSRMGIAFPQLAAEAEARWSLAPPTGLPVTYLIDEGRQVRAILKGPQTRHSIRDALAKAPLPE